MLFREWFCVGRLADLGLAEPGRVAVVDVVGESVLRDQRRGGALHAAYNVCRHRGSQLFPAEPGAGAGCAAGRALRCPYHSWTYTLTASCSRRRTPTLATSTRASSRCTRSAVEAWAGFVFVHLDARAGGAARRRARPARRREPRQLRDGRAGRPGACCSYDVAANYKVLAENYNECYHCGPVHPELIRLVPAFGGGGTGLTGRTGSRTARVRGRSRCPAPRPGAAARADADERTRHKGELVYPNLMLSCSADHVAAFVLGRWRWTAPGSTAVLLFAPDEAVADAPSTP